MTETFGWLRNYGWEVTDQPPYSPYLVPSDLYNFSTWLASDIPQTSAWSNLLPSSYRRLTMISSTPG